MGLAVILQIYKDLKRGGDTFFNSPLDIALFIGGVVILLLIFFSTAKKIYFHIIPKARVPKPSEWVELRVAEHSNRKGVSKFYIEYLDDGNWILTNKSFGTEEQAFSYKRELEQLRDEHYLKSSQG